MAEQIGGEVRTKTNLNFDGSGETTGAEEGVTKVDSGGGDDCGGSFPVEYFKKTNSDLSVGVGVFNVHGDVNLPGNATEGGSCGYETFDAEGDVQFSDFLDNIVVDGADWSIGTEEQISNYTGSERLGDLVSDVEFRTTGTAPIIITLQADNGIGDNIDGLDTDRLEYFKVAAFDVFGDDHLTGVARYGGGGGGRMDREIVVDPIPEQEGGSATAVAGGGIRNRRGPVGISANNGRDGGEAAGASGGYRSRELPVVAFSDKCSDGGERVFQRMKQQGVTVSMAVVVAMAVMMMVMLMVMVVMVSVMVRMQSNRDGAA